MQHTDSDETFCSEIERNCIPLRRSSRLNKGQRRESKYYECSEANINKKRKYTRKKPLSSIVKKTSKKNVNKQSVKAIKALKNKNVEPEPTMYVKKLKNMEKIRKNLMSWTELVRKHISGRKHMNHETAKKILSELGIIKSICSIDSNYMQVWEKLMKQYNCITCEPEANTVTKQDFYSETNPAIPFLDGSKFTQEKNTINSPTNDIVSTPQTTNKIISSEESQSILIENKATNYYNRFSQEGLRIVFKNATLVNIDKIFNNLEDTLALNSTSNSENKSFDMGESETQCETGQNVKKSEINHQMKILKITDNFPKATFNKCLLLRPKANSKEENHPTNNGSPDIIFDSQNIPENNNFTTIIHKSRGVSNKGLFGEKHIEKNDSPPSAYKQSYRGNNANKCNKKKDQKQNTTSSTQNSTNEKELGKILKSNEIFYENNKSTEILNNGSCSSSRNICLQKEYVGNEAHNTKHLRKILASSKKPTETAASISLTKHSHNILSSVSAETKQPIENAPPISFSKRSTSIRSSVFSETKKLIENSASIHFTEHSANVFSSTTTETQNKNSDKIFSINNEANVRVDPASSNNLTSLVNNHHSLLWMKHMKQVRKINPREHIPLNMFPQSFFDTPSARLTLHMKDDFEIW